MIVEALTQLGLFYRQISLSGKYYDKVFASGTRLIPLFEYTGYSLNLLANILPT